MLEISLSGEESWPADKDWQQIAERAVAAAVAESLYPDLQVSAVQIELSIRLTDDDEVHVLNRDYREKDKPTNVLSFPMLEPEEVAGIGEGPIPEAMLGDIILAQGVCAREAADKNIGFEEHASHLIVHGTLHLLGYDHMMEDEAEEMEATEIRALARLGIADPYLLQTGED